MGEIKLPQPVVLFAAVTFSTRPVMAQVRQKLVAEWGALESESDVFDFDQTNYYRDEMGTGLRKQFLVFARRIPPEALVTAKVFSNSVEEQFLAAGHRSVNIDPGYLSAAKMVLATTKNYMHRIYLGRGIFGDVHLKTVDKKLGPNPWTYPDYQTPFALDFFNKLRQSYLNELNQI